MFCELRWGSYGRANLQMPLAYGTSVVHCVECSNLIDTHRRHLQQSSNFIHDAQACETMLPLSEIENWHHGRFLVLWWIALQNLIDELVILLRELEGNASIIIRRIAVLKYGTLVSLQLLWSLNWTHNLEGIAGNS
jgi:hypothetical protein